MTAATVSTPTTSVMALRLLWGTVAVAVTAAGLGVRAWTDGPFAKYAGIALYAALIYTVVVAAAPRLRPRAVAAVALAFCYGVELAQLTPVPAQLSARSLLARLILGSTFNPPDLFWYAVGVSVVAFAHSCARRRKAKQP